MRGRALTGLLAALLLGACGQKGPLWVPGHSKNTPWPMKPAASGADPGAPAPAPPPAAPATPAASKEAAPGGTQAPQ
jgi:predicted small lipoprotein YifL